MAETTASPRRPTRTCWAMTWVRSRRMASDRSDVGSDTTVRFVRHSEPMPVVQRHAGDQLLAGIVEIVGGDVAEFERRLVKIEVALGLVADHPGRLLLRQVTKAQQRIADRRIKGVAPVVDARQRRFRLAEACPWDRPSFGRLQLVGRCFRRLNNDLRRVRQTDGGASAMIAITGALLAKLRSSAPRMRRASSSVRTASDDAEHQPEGKATGRRSAASSGTTGSSSRWQSPMTTRPLSETFDSSRRSAVRAAAFS